jgi:hypothetical protein
VTYAHTHTQSGRDRLEQYRRNVREIQQKKVSALSHHLLQPGVFNKGWRSLLWRCGLCGLLQREPPSPRTFPYQVFAPVTVGDTVSAYHPKVREKQPVRAFQATACSPWLGLRFLTHRPD